MADWAYLYAVGGQLLSDFCTVVRILPDFTAPALRSSDIAIAYTHGLRAGRRFYGPSKRLLEATLRGTDSAGSITHVDGEAGHYYENRESVLALLETSNGSDVFLERTAPHDGPVRARVRTTGVTSPDGGLLQRILIPLVFMDGWWEDDAASTVAVTGAADVVTVLGDGPVLPELVFSAAATLTHQGTGDVIVVSVGPTFPVTVDCAAKTVIDVVSVSAVGAMAPDSPWWMQLDVGANSLLASAGTVTVNWRNKRS